MRLEPIPRVAPWKIVPIRLGSSIALDRLVAGVDARFKPFGTLHSLESVGPLPRVFLYLSILVTVNIVAIGLFLASHDEPTAGFIALGWSRISVPVDRRGRSQGQRHGDRPRPRRQARKSQFDRDWHSFERPEDRNDVTSSCFLTSFRRSLSSRRVSHVLSLCPHEA